MHSIGSELESVPVVKDAWESDSEPDVAVSLSLVVVESGPVVAGEAVVSESLVSVACVVPSEVEGSGVSVAVVAGVVSSPELAVSLEDPEACERPSSVKHAAASKLQVDNRDQRIQAMSQCAVRR